VRWTYKAMGKPDIQTSSAKTLGKQQFTRPRRSSKNSELMEMDLRAGGCKMDESCLE
jgi:hypothetical protein